VRLLAAARKALATRNADALRRFLCRGFTKFNADDYQQWKEAGRIVPDGVNAKLLTNHGRMDARKPEQLFLTRATHLNRAEHLEEDA